MEMYILILTIIGIVGLAASWLPALMSRIYISYSIAFLVLGVGLYSVTDLLPWPLPFRNEEFAVRLTELIVIIALMGIGLKIDCRFNFRLWRVSFMLISITMLLSIASLAFLSSWLLGFGLASAVLLGAALAPTDPVLASDVQVDAPNEGENDPTRFALTAEAGLNDGMAFPFVWMAVALALSGAQEAWFAEWFMYDVIYRIAAGTMVGYALGRFISYLFFHLPEHHRMPDVRDGMVAISATLLVYGVTELVHGYGFIAVFVAALTIRNGEMQHEYHTKLHDFTDQVERMLLGVLLVLFGGSLVTGILDPLTWEMALLGLAFVLILRPLFGLAALIGTPISMPRKLAISFFGIRGIGSFFYLSFGMHEAEFSEAEELWALTSFIVLLSIVIHGFTAPTFIRWVRRKDSKA